MKGNHQPVVSVAFRVVLHSILLMIRVFIKIQDMGTLVKKGKILLTSIYMHYWRNFKKNWNKKVVYPKTTKSQHPRHRNPKKGNAY